MFGPLLRHTSQAAGLALTIAVCLIIGGVSACGLIYAATNMPMESATRGFPFIATVEAGDTP